MLLIHGRHAEQQLSLRAQRDGSTRRLGDGTACFRDVDHFDGLARHLLVVGVDTKRGHKPGKKEKTTSATGQSARSWGREEGPGRALTTLSPRHTADWQGLIMASVSKAIDPGAEKQSLTFVAVEHVRNPDATVASSSVWNSN